MNQSEAARAFGVSLSSVKRYVKAVREGRSLSPGKAPGKQPTLDEKARKLLQAPTLKSVRSPSTSTDRSTCERRPGCR